MSARRNTLVSLLLTTALAGILFVAPDASAPSTGACADKDQRPGLVEQSLMFEETSTYYPTGEEYVQAVYASQCITISTDLQADSYSAGVNAMPGDIVDGHGYVGILVDDTTAVGVPDGGGFVQIMRVTSEDVRRVDW